MSSSTPSRVARSPKPSSLPSIEAFRRPSDAAWWPAIPVVGVRATAYDGKYHSVDSDEMSFRMAGIHAVRAATSDVQPILLEPYVTLKVTAPEAYMGDIIGDLNSKRGRVGGMDAVGRMRVVTGEVPLGEVQRYTIDLRSITGGRGAFELEFSHYEEMPPRRPRRSSPPTKRRRIEAPLPREGGLAQMSRMIAE